MLRRILGIVVVCALACTAAFGSLHTMGNALVRFSTSQPDELVAGGPPGTIGIRTTQVPPGLDAITYTLAGDPGFSIIPQAQTTTRAAQFPDLTFIISAAATMTPGDHQVTVTATGVGFPPFVAVLSPIRVVAPTNFAVSVAPALVRMSAGETRSLAVSIVRTGGFNIGSLGSVNPITVVASAPAGVSVTPSTFTLTLPGTQNVSVTVSPQASGTLPITFTATNQILVRTARADVVVLPAIDVVAPAAVVAPSPSTILRIGGTGFAPGGTVISRSPDIVVERTTVFRPTLAEVVVSVRPGATIGAHLLVFRNPDGSESVRGGTLLVYPPESIAAPLSVRTAAIVYPVQGTIVANGEALYPRAILAMSGSGTMTGYWALDGIPFDRVVATTSAGLPIQVGAHVPLPPQMYGEHQLTLVIESPRIAAAPAVSFNVSARDVTRLTIDDPLDGESVGSKPRIQWSLVPGASGYELDVQNGERYGHVRTTQTAWMLQNLIAGPTRVRVRAIFPGNVAGEPTAWSTVYVVSREASITADEGTHGGGLGADDPPAAAPDAAKSKTYVVEPSGTLTWVSNPTGKSNLTDSASLSTQGAAGDVTASNGAKVTGNLVFDGSVDPNSLAQKSRNWTLMERRGSPALYESAGIGYMVPSFTDGTTFLNTGLARTGVIASAGFAKGTLSYYQPVEPEVKGIVSAVPQDLGIRSLAFATPEGHPFTLRAIALSAGENTGRTRTLGLFTHYTISPKAEVVVEVARGSHQSEHGNALSASIAGIVAGTTYSVGMSSVDANFVNPANPGITPGINDRFDTSLAVSHVFGKSALSLTTTRHEQGRAHDSKLARGANTDGTLTLTTAFTDHLSFTASANGGRTRTDANGSLPEANIAQSCLTAQLTETLGRITVIENASSRRKADRVDPTGDQRVQTAGLSVTGGVVTNLTLTTSANYTRTKAAPILGVTDAWSVSVIPALAIPRLLITFRPSIAFSGDSNDVTAMRTRTEQYAAAIDFSPAWLSSLLSGQIGGQVNRSMSASTVHTTHQTRSATAAMTLHLTKTRGMPMFAATPQAGTIPPAPPEPPTPVSVPH